MDVMEKNQIIIDTVADITSRTEEHNSLENQCLARGFRKIILYGYGVLGATIFRELRDSRDVNIVAIMDSFPNLVKGIPAGVPILGKEDKAPEHDAIIVAAVGVYDTIKKDLLNRGYKTILNASALWCDFDFKSKYCVLCGEYLKKFDDFGIEEEIFKKYHIIGGGKRHNAKCPNCKSLDRYRWTYLVLKEHTKIFNSKCKVLHFAPERAISDKIRQNKECDYITGDYVQGRAEYVVDATNIQFEDDSFDYIIMNHVMEHIKDEKKAICELKRVLKKDGKIILSFPICTDIETIEEKEELTPEQRLITFGQKDHIRLYGTDYKERLEQYGLNIKVFSPKNTFDKNIIEKYGLIEDDVCIIGTYMTKKKDFIGNSLQNREDNFTSRYIEPINQQISRLQKKIKNSVINDILSKMNDDNKLILSRIVMVMGTKCSLRCKDCNNLMPLFSPQSCLSANEIIQPLDNLLTKAEVLLTCELIGGEPFLQDSLEECLKYVISHDKIMNIEITTNGTIVPKNENIINLLRNEKVIVRISDYGELVNKNKIVSFLNTNNIRYEILKGTRTWVSPGGTEKRNRTINELTSQWIKCVAGKNCKTIYKGKLFSCARAASLYGLGIIKEDEYINLNKNFDINDIKQFIIRSYSIACDYCDIGTKNAKKVESAVQI